MADGNRIKTPIPPHETRLFKTSHRQDFGKQQYNSSLVWGRSAIPAVSYGFEQLLSRRCFAGCVPENLRLPMLLLDVCLGGDKNMEKIRPDSFRSIYHLTPTDFNLSTRNLGRVQ